MVCLVALCSAMFAPAGPADAQTEDTPTFHSGHSVVLRLYEASFGRSPDVAGATYWLNAYNSGEWSPRRIANFFATSDEFASIYGTNVSTEEFVAVVYENVLGRQPDQSGFDFWVGAIDDGMPRAEAILLISNAPEFIKNHPLPSDAEPDIGPTGEVVTARHVGSLLDAAAETRADDKGPTTSSDGGDDPDSGDDPPTASTCRPDVVFGPTLDAAAQINVSSDCPAGAELVGIIAADQGKAQQVGPGPVIDLAFLAQVCVGELQAIEWDLLILLPDGSELGPFTGTALRTCDAPSGSGL